MKWMNGIEREGIGERKAREGGKGGGRGVLRQGWGSRSISLLPSLAVYTWLSVPLCLSVSLRLCIFSLYFLYGPLSLSLSISLWIFLPFLSLRLLGSDSLSRSPRLPLPLISVSLCSAPHLFLSPPPLLPLSSSNLVRLAFLRVRVSDKVHQLSSLRLVRRQLRESIEHVIPLVSNQFAVVRCEVLLQRNLLPQTHREILTCTYR